MGGSPGLVVIGDDFCTRGRGFESLHRIPDRHFSHEFVVKIVLFVLRPKIKRKRGRGGPNFKKFSEM